MLQTYFATLCARSARTLLRRVFHRKASQLPGRVALGIDKNFLAHKACLFGKHTVVVCGTNGKTTTTNIIASSFDSSFPQVVCNRAGANMPAGIASALLDAASGTACVLESDELSSINIVPAVKPQFFVLLNLFRDQLDRCGEIERVQQTIVRALEASPSTTLVVCGDDPLTVGVAQSAQRLHINVVYFGINQDLHRAADRVPEARFCQLCGTELTYTYRSYAQLGAFSCPNCTFARPQLNCYADDIQLEQNSVKFCAHINQHTAQISASFGGLYMVYNLLAAYYIAHETGISDEAFLNVLNAYHPQNGRLQHFTYQGIPLVLNLAKNPTGFNQNISLLQEDPRQKVIYICINDNFNDGKDVSWLWDVDFERFSSEDKPVLLCGGTRRHDMQVRLKYAGFSSECTTSIDEVLATISKHYPNRVLYVLTNYSALWPVKARLEQLCTAQ